MSSTQDLWLGKPDERERFLVVKPDRLTRICAALLKATGASEEVHAVATGCVNANLAGHDSHGVIAILGYIDSTKAGDILRGAEWTIVRESSTTAVIDGHWVFAFHVNTKAMGLAIEKAKTANVAACTVFNQSYVGRLAAHPLMAATAGMIGLAIADSGRSPKYVAPFGRREARLGTNPISIAVPSNLEASFLLDMATSAVAAGKLELAIARGEKIPKGWLIDAEGCAQPTPRSYRKGGVLPATRRHQGLQAQRPRSNRGTVPRPADRPWFPIQPSGGGISAALSLCSL
ncbi:malate/L-lactate dehydrogenase family protein (plasmid) [Rhizobium gallicum]|uniref:Malate/L-lactate dehydrogenase family protein n=1 Tax=Rhizobium gallicum TaxID=56730 RepID=A0A1L5NR53_9HYPH|nr:Ldh family oxidoreductase [Rhizobium gallicum]APO70352.1 malate/L-lactate dehydrogenase family protein [Rhizobium gallicum]